MFYRVQFLRSIFSNVLVCWCLWGLEAKVDILVFAFVRSKGWKYHVYFSSFMLLELVKFVGQLVYGFKTVRFMSPDIMRLLRLHFFVELKSRWLIWDHPLFCCWWILSQCRLTMGTSNLVSSLMLPQWRSITSSSLFVLDATIQITFSGYRSLLLGQLDLTAVLVFSSVAEKVLQMSFPQVDKGFVAQVADVAGGRSAPMNEEQRVEAEKTIVGEFSEVKHARGILSMGR